MNDVLAIRFLFEHPLEARFDNNISRFANALFTNYNEITRVMKRIRQGGYSGKLYSKLFQLYAESGWSIDEVMRLYREGSKNGGSMRYLDCVEMQKIMSVSSSVDLSLKYLAFLPGFIKIAVSYIDAIAEQGGIDCENCHDLKDACPCKVTANFISWKLANND